MRAALPALAIAAALATPAFATEPAIPAKGVHANDAAKAQPIGIAKTGLAPAATPSMDDDARLHVSTYRVALLPSADPDATFADRVAAIAKALEGGTQADARQRLATLGDVTSVLPKVLIDPSDEGRNAITLSEATTTYVRSMTSGGEHDGEAVFDKVRTGDGVIFEHLMTAGGPEIHFRARSTHVRLNTFSSGGQTIQLPDVDRVDSNGPIVLPRGGVVPAVVRDATAPNGDTAIVYVVSRAG